MTDSMQRCVVVPMEPTEEMVRAGNNRISYPRFTLTSLVATDVYRAMLAAAPHQNAAPQASPSVAQADSESGSAVGPVGAAPSARCVVVPPEVLDAAQWYGEDAVIGAPKLGKIVKFVLDLAAAPHQRD